MLTKTILATTVAFTIPHCQTLRGQGVATNSALFEEPLRQTEVTMIRATNVEGASLNIRHGYQIGDSQVTCEIRYLNNNEDCPLDLAECWDAVALEPTSSARCEPLNSPNYLMTRALPIDEIGAFEDGVFNPRGEYRGVERTMLTEVIDDPNGEYIYAVYHDADVVEGWLTRLPHEERNHPVFAYGRGDNSSSWLVFKKPN